MARWNPQGDYPKIDNTAYIDPTATIIGAVSIAEGVFVGPCTVLRADEKGSSITIKNNCNIQDRVIIHALKNTSVFIGGNTSLAHGCIIHGPCKIGKNCFVGFGSVVFNTEVGKNVFIKHLAVIEGVDIPSGKLIPNGAIIDSKDKLKDLKPLSKELEVFSEDVIMTNLDLARRYRNDIILEGIPKMDSLKY